MRLIQMLKEPAHFIMITDEGELHLVTGAPKKNALGQSRSNLPQPWSQSGQPEAAWELSGCQGAYEQVNAALKLQLLDGVKALQAAPEGCVKTAPHSQAPEIAKRGIGGAERAPSCPALGQSGQRRQLFIGQRRFRDDSGFGQQNASSFNDKSDNATPLTQMQRLSDRFWQAELAIRSDISGNN